MSKRKHRKISPFSSRDFKKLEDGNQGIRIDLYKVTGIAPTYTFPHDTLCGRRTWKNVIMNWWILRDMPFRVDYKYIFGDNCSDKDIVAANQSFLFKEAELYKDWLDGLYPEENTEITKIKYPAIDLPAYAIDFDGEKGSLWSVHPLWHYAWRICYYIDTRNCEKLN